MSEVFRATRPASFFGRRILFWRTPLLVMRDGGACFSPRKIQVFKEPSESQAAGELDGRRYKASVSSVCFCLNRVIGRHAQRAADSEDNKVKQGAWQTRRPLPEERFINYANLQPSERPERNREFEVAADRASVPLSSHRGASPRKGNGNKGPKIS